MKILKLKSENVKRLSVVEITPDGALITIGGKNGAGKSSVLDSIAYVLGGDKLVPSQPIHSGEKEAKITVDLGDYIVERKFMREEIVDETQGKTPPVHIGWGPTKSTLTVKNPQGAKYPSPQALLDKLYGKLTFDPLAFSREKDTVQNDILRRLVGLDFTLLNQQRKIVFDQRAIDKKTFAIEENKLSNLPKHPTKQGVYETTTQSIDELSNRLQLGQALENDAQAARHNVEREKNALTRLEAEREQYLRSIEDLERRLAAAKATLAKCEDAIQVQTDTVAKHVELAKQAADAVPDFTELHAQLSAANKANEQARDNKAYLAQEERVKDLQFKIDEGTKAIESIDQSKENALRSAKFPVDGLSLTDEGVLYEGLPLAEVSASVQLRVSIAIGLALNPTLKVLLIRNGNLLDEDGLKLVAEMAADDGAQVWMEYVTSSGEGVSVMLEDGHLA